MKGTKRKNKKSGVNELGCKMKYHHKFKLEFCLLKIKLTRKIHYGKQPKIGVLKWFIFSVVVGLYASGILKIEFAVMILQLMYD